MYCPYWNLRICKNCALVIRLVFQKRLDPVGWRSLFESHLFTYGKVFVVREMSALLHSLLMYVLRLCTEPSCWVDVGVIDRASGVLLGGRGC